MNRCDWTGEEGLSVRYHDEEWGVPIYDDRRQFEFLLLEGAQAGLSWLTVLRKREGYRAAFDAFDPERVAAYDEKRRERLLADPGIIRNRLKIASAVNNARRFLAVREEYGSFSNYLWGFVDGKPLVNHRRSIAEIPPRTELSDLVSKELKKRGFTFVGSTIIYSHLQATGLVNDHLESCFRFEEVQKLARRPESGPI